MRRGAPNCCKHSMAQCVRSGKGQPRQELYWVCYACGNEQDYNPWRSWGPVRWCSRPALDDGEIDKIPKWVGRDAWQWDDRAFAPVPLNLIINTVVRWWWALRLLRPSLRVKEMHRAYDRGYHAAVVDQSEVFNGNR